jgi:hypothetical protein
MSIESKVWGGWTFFLMMITGLLMLGSPDSAYPFDAYHVAGLIFAAFICACVMAAVMHFELYDPGKLEALWKRLFKSQH